MTIEVNQNTMSIRIKIMAGEAKGYQDEVALVYKRWEWTKDSTPLFRDFVIEPANAQTYRFSHDSRSPVSAILRENIHNSIGAFLAYQLDQMFKTQDDFKRPVKVVQYGPVFYVEWDEATDDNP